MAIEREKHIASVSSRLENGLIDIESEIAPESFFLKVGRGAWYSYNVNFEKFWEYYGNLCSFLKSSPDIYAFDEKGELISPTSVNLKSRFIASKLWNSINSDYEERKNIAVKFKKQFVSFLGKEFKLGTFIDRRNLLMPIVVNTKTGYIYWNNMPDNPKKGIMVVFWEIPEFTFRLEQILERHASLFDDGFVKYKNGDIKSIFSSDKSLNLKNISYEKTFLDTVLIERNDDYIDSNGLLWKYIKTNRTHLLAALQSDTAFFGNLKWYFNFLVCFMAVMSAFVYVWLMKQQTHFFSIKIKLITLFLIAVFSPVMGFAYLGYQYIADMKNNLITEFGNSGRNILLNIDRELGSSGNAFREDFRNMVSDFQKYDEDSKIRDKFKEKLEKQDLALIERRRVSNASLIKEITNKVIFDGMSEITEPFSKCCIDTMLNTNLMATTDPGFASALKAPDSGLSSFWARPDNVQDFSFGTLEFYLYWCFAHSKTYGKEFFLVLRITDNVLRERLRQRILECKTNAKEKDFIVVAYNSNKGEWFSDNSLARSLKKFSDRVNYVGKPIESEVKLGNERYLLLGLNSSRLKGYSFYALYPYNKIEIKLNNILRYIIFGILLFIIVAWAIGYQLAQTFLYPVKRLEDGINAIKERNSEFRIESMQNDEFGSLALSFNKVIGDLKEMELAKYIQEALLPKSMPEIKGYEISFSNTMASAVGGDYFDVFLLDEDNLCIIIGDVSGHGVASALVMAIAKAVLYHGFKETRDLIELFNDLNSVIKTYFSGSEVKKMITLFATIINLPSGKAVFLDAGHNFPFVVSANGEITEIEMTSVPVGILKKLKNKKTGEYNISNGDYVVFYTDGIVEATGKTEEQYGYERFRQHLSEMANATSKYVMESLIDSYNKWKDGTEADDDVSLVVLRRCSS